MKTDPYHLVAFLGFDIVVNPLSAGIIIGFVILLFLLGASALISGSEVACFSFSPAKLQILRSRKNKKSEMLLDLLKRPQRLLATILIANNFVNIGIIILAAFVSESLFDFTQAPMAGFLFEVGVVTFLLLLFGEILPKVYASHSVIKFATFMAYPLSFLGKIFSPVSSFLMYSTSIINRRFGKKTQNISINDLSDALDLTSNSLEDDHKILSGIVRFGNIDAKGIMCPRIDVVAVDNRSSFSKLLSIIVESGYSRIPIFEETFDKVKGVLYIKDLLPYVDKDGDFEWKHLIRPPYFVPENKKINDLLEEFQKKKIHMAIVVDEYGGTHGIVTLEDILEEIVGEIVDENDEVEISHQKIDDKNYIFEGKTLLYDFYKVLNIKTDMFEETKGDAETLAGLILELKGEIPKKNEIILHQNFIFQITAVDNRRIKKLKVTIN